jgi:hypothetical protein
MFKHLIAAVAAIALLGPVAARAQDLPSYARPAAQADHQIHGRVATFDGGYNVGVRDENGYTDNVVMHDGTIINPTGLTLAPGMVVSILGYNAGSYFAADEIDTPYNFDDGVAYYGGEPWYDYGPDISLGFFFGSGGWWHGGSYRGGGYGRGSVGYHGGGYSGGASYHSAGSFGGHASFSGGHSSGGGRR